MLSSVFAKTIRDQRRSLVGWGLCLVALVSLLAALWPSFRDMPGLATLVEDYPEPLRELFAMDDLTTPQGFLDAELYSFLVPTLFLIFSIGRGARSIAGEEESGLLEPVLATPLGRGRLLVEKAAGLGVVIVLLAAVLFGASFLAGEAAGMDVPIHEHASAAVDMAAIGILFGWIALAVGAATGSRSLALSATAVVAGATYLLFVLSRFVDAVERFQILSPFHALLDEGVVGAGLGPVAVVLVAVAAGAVAAAVPVFDRRDVATA